SGANPASTIFREPVATEQKERELVGSQAGLASAIAVESHGELGEIEAVRARGYWEQVWRRFRRDKVAILSGGFIVFLVFVAIAGGPIAAHFLGHGPNDLNLSAGLSGLSQLPVGPLSHVPCSGFAAPPSGCVGHPQGTQLYILGADGQLGNDEFLPQLVAPIIVYSTLSMASFIILEASLSFLGLGIDSRVPSWGNLLSTGPEYYLTQPWLMVWPGLAILFTTLAFNLLGDGLRDAFDPRSAR